MNKIIPLIYCLYLYSLGIGYSQSTPPADDYLPPTPTVAALGKYVDAPVSLYTGTPEISIPIYEINCRGFKLPITLSYHAGGFRVEEESSWIGLGWSLNATGVITRTIRHRLDNAFRPSFFDTYDGRVLNPNSSEDYTDLMLMEDNIAIDGFPDLYTYSFTGHSGKFIYTNSSVEMLPKKAVAITKVSNGWSAKDEAGITYYFTQIEKAKTRSTGTATFNDISWYLSKIVTVTGDEILFEYKDTEFTQSVNLSQAEHYKQVLLHYDFHENSSDVFTTTQYGKELSKIKFPHGEIEFISDYNREDISKSVEAVGALRLTAIKVTDKAGAINRMFYLNQDYFRASAANTPAQKRLKLMSFAEEMGTPTGQDYKVYTFEYNTGVELPAKTSKAQDHWGYFNNKTTNTSLVPPLINNTEVAIGPTREPDPLVTKASLLTKIIYPTGGYTEYEYEGHDYGYVNQNAIPSRQEKINIVNYGLGVSGYTNRPEMIPSTQPFQSEYFDIPREQSVKIEIQIIYPDTYVIGSHSLAQVELYSAPEEGVPETLLETYVIQENGPHYLDLPAGRYKVHAIGTMERGFAHAFVTYQNFDLTTVKKKFTGGARVRKITEHDGSNPDIVRLISYTKSEDTIRSSGSLLEEPNYFKWYYRYVEIDGPCVYKEIPMLSITSESKYPLGSGNHIGYSEVQVIYGDNGENGMSISTFTTQGNLPGGTNSDISWERGLLLTRSDYDAGGNMVRLLSNEYESAGYQQFYGLLVTLVAEHPCAPDTGPPSASAPAYFDQSLSIMASELYYLKKQVTEEYSNGTKLINTTEYFYDNLVHLQPTRTNTEAGNKRIVKSVSYPDDFTDASGFVSDLKNQHVIVPIESVTWQEDLNGSNAAILSSQLRLYQPGGKGLLEETKLLEIASPLVFSNFKFANRNIGELPPFGTAGNFSPDTKYRSKTLISYDGNFNPIQVSSNTAPPTSFIWGYQKLFPIAKVVNATSSQVAYTGFENDNEGNWEPYTVNQSVSRTGSKGYMGSLTKSNLPLANYLITLWVKDGTGTPSVSGLSPVLTSEVINGWKLMKWQANLSGTVTISTNGSTIDDVRLSPSNSMMTTLTYDPLKGPTSITDSNNVISYYDYDLMGRLKSTRDTKGSIVGSYLYHYQQ